MIWTPSIKCRTAARSVSISSVIYTPRLGLIMLVRYCRGSGECRCPDRCTRRESLTSWRLSRRNEPYGVRLTGVVRDHWAVLVRASCVAYRTVQFLPPGVQPETW